MSLRLVSRRIVNASSGGLLSSVMRAQSAALVFRASSATRFPVNQRARAPAALAASAVLASQSSPAIADAAVLSSSGALASAPVAGVASSGLATTAAEPLSVAAMAADAVAVSGLDAGFPSWYPTSWLSWVLMKAMSDAVATGGIEWWAAIAGVSFALRPLTVPSAIISQRTSAWFGFHKESLASYQARIAAANKAEDRAAASQAIADYRAFLSKSGLDVFRGMFGPIAGQAFVFISMYSAIRWLVDDAALIPGFSEGGAGLGLALLTVPDPTFCIPALAAVFTAASIVVNPNLVGIPDRGLSAGGHKLSFAALSFLFTSITCFFPAVRSTPRDYLRPLLSPHPPCHTPRYYPHAGHSTAPLNFRIYEFSAKFHSPTKVGQLSSWISAFLPSRASERRARAPFIGCSSFRRKSASAIYDG